MAICAETWPSFVGIEISPIRKTHRHSGPLSGILIFLFDVWKGTFQINCLNCLRYRRTGLGRALCTECEKCTTDEWKIDEIALQVEKDNIPAVSLYRKDGYKEVRPISKDSIY